MLKIVVLYLLTVNPDTGIQLFSKRYEQDQFSVSNNPIEDCRIEGVRMAHELSDYFRQYYPNASTNVDCQWEYKK